jgi:hypothetical protein
MKKSLRIFVVGMALMAQAAVAMADATYAYTNPTYIPTAVSDPATYSAPADYVFQSNDISTATVRISGTCTSLASAVQGTNDGTNWTTLQAIPVAGGSVVTSLTGAGFWRANTAGFTKSRLHITALTAACTVAMAGTSSPGALYLMNPNTQTNPISIVDSTAAYNWAISSLGIGSVAITNGTQTMPTMDAAARAGFVKMTDGTTVAGVTVASTVPVAATPALVVAQSPNVIDPCASSMIAKSSAIINQSSSATTKVVDVSASTVIYVCGFTATASGTSPAFTFTSGTHVSADCDTGAALLSGAMVPSATVGVVSAGYGGTMFKTAAAKQLCLTTGATTSVQGVLSYVQQ